VRLQGTLAAFAVLVKPVSAIGRFQNEHQTLNPSDLDVLVFECRSLAKM
jgi:hypothetical protein